MKLRPKNWESFQHYKDRKPPWIKLYRNILDDKDYLRLPVASRALAPCLWLIASESENGEFDGDVDTIAFRLRLTDEEVKEGLSPLIDKGFFICASKTLAKRLQDAIPETERENRERNIKQPVVQEKKPRDPRKTRFDENLTLPTDWAEIAVKMHSDIDAAATFEAFKAHHLAHGKVMVDWKRAWITWLHNAKNFGYPKRVQRWY